VCVGRIHWIIYRGDVCKSLLYAARRIPDPNRAVLELDHLLANIHASRQADGTIVANEDRWRSVFENSAIGIAMAELNGRLW
jgi:hypothetical protein